MFLLTMYVLYKEYTSSNKLLERSTKRSVNHKESCDRQKKKKMHPIGELEELCFNKRQNSNSSYYLTRQNLVVVDA